MAGWAEENGMAGEPYADVVASPQVQEMVGRYVDELNGHLNRWETVKKWRVLDHDLTIESGELTPSLKVKRNVVEERHRELIDAFYN
jgi:long-chain acyl-CoA synthetase